MEGNDMLVSVVVLTYNDSSFIEETLNSIKKQTYKNIELVVSDDCSSDDTLERCKRWIELNGARFSNVQLLTVEKNTGVTHNITRAQKAANGQWIKGLGGDDLLTLDCIEQFVGYVKLNPSAKIVQCGLIKIDENSDIISYGVKGPNNYFHRDSTSAYWQHQFLLRKDPVDALGLFKSKELLVAVDYYDCEFPMQEDVAFTMKVVSNGYKIWLLDKFLVKRRMRVGTLSGLSDNTLVNKNDIIRIDINKKYFIPHLGWLERRLLIYKDFINKLIFNTPFLNRKLSAVCRVLRATLQLPYIAVRTYKLNHIIRHL